VVVVFAAGRRAAKLRAGIGEQVIRATTLSKLDLDLLGTGQPVLTRKEPGDHDRPAVLSHTFRAVRLRNRSKNAQQTGADPAFF
jgi:hypothetical protein